MATFTAAPPVVDSAAPSTAVAAPASARVAAAAAAPAAAPVAVAPVAALVVGSTGAAAAPAAARVAALVNTPSAEIAIPPPAVVVVSSIVPVALAVLPASMMMAARASKTTVSASATVEWSAPTPLFGIRKHDVSICPVFLLTITKAPPIINSSSGVGPWRRPSIDAAQWASRSSGVLPSKPHKQKAVRSPPSRNSLLVGLGHFGRVR